MTDKEKKENLMGIYIFLGGYIVFMTILLTLNYYNL